MTLTAAAKIELIETALADGKYRTLQKQLRDLRDAQQIIVQRYLSDSHESLKAEANRIILELKPIAETQDGIETVEQKTDEVIDFSRHEIIEQKINEVLASLPADTIVDNSAFGDRINTGNADEKIWLVKKDGNGKGVTFVKTECGQYYQSYAGDALRSIILLGMPTFIWAKVLKTQVAVPDAVRLQKDAQKLGLTLHFYNRPLDTETPQDATATTESTLPETLENGFVTVSDFLAGDEQSITSALKDSEFKYQIKLHPFDPAALWKTSAFRVYASEKNLEAIRDFCRQVQIAN